MIRTQRGRPRPRALPVLVAMLLAGGAAVVLSGPFHTTPTGVESMELTGPAAVVGMTEAPASDDSASAGCAAAETVDPGQYENRLRSGTPDATWVIVPDSYEAMIPAPLYVLSAFGFTGSTDDLDRLSPVFEALDGVVLVTAMGVNDAEFETLTDEVLYDFCIDPNQIVTSMVPLPGSQVPREPDQPGPESRNANA